jgi:hypothetical protein
MLRPFPFYLPLFTNVEEGVFSEVHLTSYSRLLQELALAHYPRRRVFMPDSGYEAITRRDSRKEDKMSEERPQHTQEPAEGSDEDVEAPGAQRAAESGAASQMPGGEARPSRPRHTAEPAEGADEDVEAPGSERAAED